ncbi:MAG: hypothetical protein Crog4KO_30480 [Crocinitomicaceae bacterium]
MRSIIFFAILSLSFGANTQVSFDQVYSNHPDLPEGVLEAVAWTNTRMHHLENQTASCSGYPQAYGIMGLHDNGHGYFIENGTKVATISGISVAQQKSDPQLQVEAYAIALETFLTPANGKYYGDEIAIALMQLSEIPDSGLVNILAREMQIYEVLKFMRNPQKAQEFGFSPYNFDLEMIFGEEHLAILSAEKITLSETSITNENGANFTLNSNASLQYGPAIWNPAPACNFSSRNGVPVSAITIHTIQGTYAGAISWSQNCASNVSFHYVIRSSDGQVTQMVFEEDKGWHVGSENPYTIGYEHEGYVSDPIWYTDAMYNSSADLSRDIINSGYGISGLRTYFGPSSSTTDLLGGCTKIKGHQHFANQTHTDPGINWDWERYYQLINNALSYTTLTAASGTLTDSGGSGGDYADDERLFWLIQPSNAGSITLNFGTFNIEQDWDYLFIYDGDSLNDPLIGQFTGNTIPQIVSSGGSLLLEFRSDCSTTQAGWEASYVTTPLDLTGPQTSITAGNTWQTDDFDVDFVDLDSLSTVSERYYLVAEKEIAENAPSGNGSYGFAQEAFEDGVAQWTDVTGAFIQQSGAYTFSDTSEQNSNTYLSVEQNSNQGYLYSWSQTIEGIASNQRAGMHFFCSDATQSNRGNSYFVYLRASDLVQIYSVDNNVYTLEADLPYTIDNNVTYDCRVQYDPSTGWIRVFVDGNFVGEWQDATPLTSGNAISLRSGGCAVSFDNVRVYQSRGSQATIPAGFGELMSIESEGAIPTGFIYALSIDDLDNWSQEAQDSYLLDFTQPEMLHLHDGSGSDIDTAFTPTLEANWMGEDIHSAVANYEVAIGTLPALDDVVGWTSNGLYETFSHVLSNPTYNEVYHIAVRATNGAGLQETFLSDGQRFIDDLGLNNQDWTDVNVYPNPTSDFITIDGLSGRFIILLYDASGKVCLERKMESNKPINISALATGHYKLVIQSGSQFIVKPVYKH